VSECARCLAPLAGIASATRYKNASVCPTNRESYRNCDNMNSLLVPGLEMYVGVARGA
jgi:hypothetical protein